MGLFSSLPGYGDAAETYAANATAQWRVLEAAFTNPPTQEWLNFHATFVANYGAPAATEAEQKQRSLKAYRDGIDAALADGFLDGVKSVPAAVSGAVTAATASFWDGLPAWAKWAAAAALALLAINTLANAGILSRKTK